MGPEERYQDCQGPREYVLLGVVKGAEPIGEEGQSNSTLQLLEVELQI